MDPIFRKWRIETIHHQSQDALGWLDETLETSFDALARLRQKLGLPPPKHDEFSRIVAPLVPMARASLERAIDKNVIRTWAHVNRLTQLTELFGGTAIVLGDSDLQDQINHARMVHVQAFGRLARARSAAEFV